MCHARCRSRIQNTTYRTNPPQGSFVVFIPTPGTYLLFMQVSIHWAHELPSRSAAVRASLYLFLRIISMLGALAESLRKLKNTVLA